MKAKRMTKRILIFFIFLLLTACSGDESLYVLVFKLDRADSTETATPVSPTATVSPTGTPTPTITPTVEPTPTQENLNRIRITANTNIRLSPNGTVCRVGTANSQFNVLSRQGDWLQIADSTCSPAWIFNGSWVTFISGSLGNVPVSQANSQNRLGYNVLGVTDQTYHFAHLQAICPRYMLYMDNLALAIEAYDRLHESCGTNIIHRNYSSFEGEEFLNRTPSQIVSQWIAEGHPEIIRYSTNEPSCGGNTPCSVLVAHEVELARLARQAGFTVSLGNLGVGKFSPIEVTNGVYNPLIRAIVDYGHIFGAHEYTWGCLCFGFGTLAKSALNQPNLMQAAFWTPSIPYAFTPFNSQRYEVQLDYGTEAMQAAYANAYVAQAMAQLTCGNLPSFWHLGRSFWILLWAECTLGIDSSQIKVVHTEWGWDYLSDINDVIEPLRNQFAHPQYKYNLRGWRSLEYLWAFYWGDWSMEEAAYNQIEWAVDKYPENHSFLLFAWSDDRNRDWTLSGFSFGNYGDPVTIRLHRLIEGS